MKAHSKKCEDNFQAGGQACICEQHRPHPPQTNLTVEELLNRTCWCCGAHTREFWQAEERARQQFWESPEGQENLSGVSFRAGFEAGAAWARGANLEYSQPSTRELIETIRKASLQPKLTPMASVAIREALADLEKRIGGE
jgi:hypothetical protein